MIILVRAEDSQALGTAICRDGREVSRILKGKKRVD